MPTRRSTLMSLLVCAWPGRALSADEPGWRRIRSDDESGELSVPPGWRAQVQDDAVALLSPEPATVVISLGRYEPRDDGRYSSWSSWTGHMLARRKEHAPVKHRAISVAGFRALRVEPLSTPRGHLVVETWIAIPHPKPAGSGEVMALVLDSSGAIPETRPFLQLYERILRSVTFPAAPR